MTLGRIKFQHLMMGLGLLLMASPLVDINTKGEVLHYHRVVYMLGPHLIILIYAERFTALRISRSVAAAASLGNFSGRVRYSP